ncbi:gem-associated protein 8 [Cephus cinctus]|uniref:Gem-associated protein 8 n=1 Tax=Cephus cinctus TaxID=211228 RepID=A0AAJ7CFU5_CEPCN|nr:gem-associated protein 8 [Cephus cinctus]
MDVSAQKRSRNRKRKRHGKNRRQARLEVRSAKRRKVTVERNIFRVNPAMDRLFNESLSADAFWENYAAAQEWQKRHNIAWWRSRCYALEHENDVLRATVRSLASASNLQDTSKTDHREPMNNHLQEEENEDDDAEEDDEDESLEFQVDEDMLNFLEQSMRHKMELKRAKESERKSNEKDKVPGDNARLEGGAAWTKARTEGAKLLYGDASAGILAMETALQATLDRHKDKAKPQYWPNIPLNI